MQKLILLFYIFTMGNSLSLNSIPIVSQLKSAIQAIAGDFPGAKKTQEDFAYRNTFPLTSQLSSAAHAIRGDLEAAANLQKNFLNDMSDVVSSVPIVGHIKGGVHYALGQSAQGEDALKSASRTTAVLAGALGGLVTGGPVGAAAGGVAGGLAIDSIISGAEVLSKGRDANPYGTTLLIKETIGAINGKSNISVGEAFDLATLPVMDGLAGLGLKHPGNPNVKLVNGKKYIKLEQTHVTANTKPNFAIVTPVIRSGVTSLVSEFPEGKALTEPDVSFASETLDKEELEGFKEGEEFETCDF